MSAPRESPGPTSGPASGPAPGRPPHLQPRFIGLVALGGAVGTLTRYLIQQAVPPTGFPVATMAINIVGAFLLGLLLATLARRGDDSGSRRSLRLLLGTGLLGGFTTYSALALDTVSLAGGADASNAAIYAFGTLIVGVLAAGLGIRLGSGPRSAAVRRTVGR
ncbi:fluoride efflux transporter FluC [Naasia lichenicola]|uniref:Fluoride-specific ion channel FluC n=1 Tax=Naasia lichenicola TaxID=2565933 RepID=A0A4S4FNM5_9MICO|nr:CrcB family protein [Naasia lichenicola]THG31854.1 CrcB family protein [Naasia lichenicola]